MHNKTEKESRNTKGDKMKAYKNNWPLITSIILSLLSFSALSKDDDQKLIVTWGSANTTIIKTFPGTTTGVTENFSFKQNHYCGY